MKFLSVRWRLLASLFFRDAWMVWLFIGGLSWAWLFGWLLTRTLADQVRFAGMMLQVFGVACVLIGLDKLRKLFGKLPLKDRISSWFVNLVRAFIRPRIIAVEGAMLGSSLQVHGDGAVLQVARPGTALDERVSALEESVRELQREMGEGIRGVRREIAEAHEVMRRERQERLVDSRTIAEKLEESTVGDLDVQFLGVLWLLVGIVGTSVPGELAWAIASAWPRSPAVVNLATSIVVPPAKGLDMLSLVASMNDSGWLMIVAVLLAPILAVQVQKRLEVLREKRNRRLELFRTLMATRAAKVSPEHVQALNMIDIEFYGHELLRLSSRSKAEKAVVDAWKLYLDHLNTGPGGQQPPEQAAIAAWVAKGDDHLTDLLYEMSKALGYDFDKVLLKRGIYSPQAHGREELFQQGLRAGLARLLSGSAAIHIVVDPAPPEAQASDPAARP